MDAIAAATARLLAARRGGQPQPATGLPLLPDADAAYAVQVQVAAALGWFADAPGGVAGHWKSGGPARGAALTHAPLPPAGVHPSGALLAELPFQFRGIEAEIALRLGEDVDAARAAAADGAPIAVDAMCVAIEVVDSRWAEGPAAPALARLADLQSHGALVLGGWLPFPARAEARDWAAQRLQVDIDGTVHAFQGTHTLGDPAWGLAAFVRHATRHGARLPAGTVVTTGTWCGLLMAQRGDAVRVLFDGLGEARLQL